MKVLPIESLILLPQSRFISAFTYTLKADTAPRYLEIFRWDDRLVAYEGENELWWCTLDTCGRRDVREFWQECVANERVGRLCSVERAFQRSSPSGATLEIGPLPMYVVVAQDNSGIACIHEEMLWYSFPAGKVGNVHKPLAMKPTLWSRHFQLNIALRSLGVLGAVLERDVLARMPEPIRELWEQGASALPVRLAAAALAFGWANSLRDGLTVPQFWQAVLCSRPHFSGASNEPCALPDGLLSSPEADLPGHFILPHFAHPEGKLSAVLLCQLGKSLLRIGFRSWNESAHELMEHRLELRDWLSQFFPQDEVESLFAS